MAESYIPIMAEYHLCNYWTKICHWNCAKFGIWILTGAWKKKGFSCMSFSPLMV